MAAISTNQMCATGEASSNVPHAVAAHFRQRHLHAAFFADNALILHTLVLAAKTFIVFDGTQDARTE